MRAIRRLLPRSLAGQLIALLLVVLVASQLISLVVFVGERRAALQTANRVQIVGRTATMVRLLAETPPEMTDRLILTASSADLRLWIAETSALEANTEPRRGDRLRNLLQSRLAEVGVREVRVEISAPDNFIDRPPRPRFRPPSSDRPFARRPARNGDGPPPQFGPLDMTLAIQMSDGRWLNAVTRKSQEAEWAMAFFVSLVSAAGAIVMVVVLVVRRLTRPLRALTDAAERVGRGEDVPPLTEYGPEDVRRTTRAFNRMQERLRRFVADRTQMLAAVSHDLRSPITVLRLRAEFVDDPETREKIVATLDEMEAMTDSALNFLRQDADVEETRTIDLTSLVEAVCTDLDDAGADIQFGAQPSIKIRGRSGALKRAVRNLVENAVIYGQRVRVALTVDNDRRRVNIVIEDDGPGLAEEQWEQAFTPFYRVEDSRNRATGGVGLGLSIARTIVRAHGGDIGFSRSPAGKFRTVMWLPASPAG